MGSSGGERFAGHGLPDSDRSRLRAISWYLTLGGCHVAVFATGESSFSYRCEGCNAQPYRTGGRLQALSRANQHAAQCRAARSQHYRDAAEIAREVTTDVRAELPRVDARAAAGIALSAAVLIGTIEAPRTMPLLAFAVIGAALLTIALLLFFAVLLPVSGKAARASARRWATLKSVASRNAAIHPLRPAATCASAKPKNACNSVRVNGLRPGRPW
jgi:hypothetical protein